MRIQEITESRIEIMTYINNKLKELRAERKNYEMFTTEYNSINDEIAKLTNKGKKLLAKRT